MIIDPMLIDCLQSYKNVELSTDPDIPGPDERILHTIKGHDVIETKTGFLLLVHLENPQTGEEYTYSYPDIVKTEFVNHSDRHDKWYIYSLDRSEFKHETRYKKMTYRLIFKK
ncbi:hypothetical protein ACPZJV_03625 [Bacillus velezensis]|uniref:hypothetical protein n=1 Tax=Bacillus TaxID=1386 RepID=UPI00044B8D93|nr:MULTISPECIES: hypothetical protein [Bacillus amyloliquefaciens group]EYB35400.1 hypothetical protein AW26_0114925 [Bacillus amyloliquefaciens EBL11]MEC0927927.1 hypothetical protein [Bacillus velezensis]MEC0972297.1 hypothetical protein [Bacillus velezensis]NYZ56464.1 hypothetical protein [Bacillus amyloliquefaciens]QWC47558.1 hypothetical protein KH238_02740 [Bacillus velezensis]